MRRPPPIAEAVRYPGTAALAALAVIASLLYWSGAVDMSPLLETFDTARQPWRLLTTTLLHGDIIHLVFNVYWLWTFGTAIEGRFGTARTLALYAFLGAGSSAAELALFDGGIGLSGIGYGLFGFLFVLAKRDPRLADAIDAGTVRLFAVWFVVCLVLTLVGVWQIANVAHAAGCIFGIGIGAAVSSTGTRRHAITGAIAALFVASFAGVGPLYEHVNMGNNAGARDAYEGYVALEEERWADAELLLERAVARDASDARSWHNLGYVRAQLGELEAAKEAFERVLALDHGNTAAREAVEALNEELAATRNP